MSYLTANIARETPFTPGRHGASSPAAPAAGELVLDQVAPERAEQG
jgi:hypothetical protein